MEQIPSDDPRDAEIADNVLRQAIILLSTTVVTKWQQRDDVYSDSDEQWLDGCGGKRTT